MSQADVAMFVYGDAAHDSRVLREADAIAASGRRVVVLAHPAPGLPASELHEGWELLRVGATNAVRPGDPSPRRTARQRVSWLLRYLRGLDEWAGAAARIAGRRLTGAPTTVWHGHDLTGLVAAARAHRRWGGSLVYDSHELFMEAGTAARLPGPARSLVARIERRLARRSDLVITVNSGIAAELARRYQITLPSVVMNCPTVAESAPSREQSPLRSTLGLRDRPVLLHHGGLATGRGIVETIAALDGLPPDVALVMLGNGELVPRILELARDTYRDRLFHHPAVPVSELPEWVAGADAGVIAFQPVEGNNLFATPNKLFECLAVGVPVVVSDFPEMSRIVGDAAVGATCDPSDPASIARAISTVLDGDREQWFHTCRAAAFDRYSWQRQSKVLLDGYDRLVDGA